jgi:hypothetical protein
VLANTELLNFISAVLYRPLPFAAKADAFQGVLAEPIVVLCTPFGCLSVSHLIPKESPPSPLRAAYSLNKVTFKLNSVIKFNLF